MTAACVPEAAAVRPGTIGAVHHGAAKGHVPLPVPDAGVAVALGVAGASGQRPRREQCGDQLRYPHPRIVSPGSRRAEEFGWPLGLGTVGEERSEDLGQSAAVEEVAAAVVHAGLATRDRGGERERV